MIPTMILFGIILGRWWASTVVFGAIFWPVILLASDAMGVDPGLLATAGLGAANAAVGVLVHQVILWIIRRARERKRSS